MCLALLLPPTQSCVVYEFDLKLRGGLSPNKAVFE